MALKRMVALFLALAAFAAGEDCAPLPSLCTGEATMAGQVTVLTYLCPDKTIHVTVTKTVTVTPTVIETGAGSSPPTEQPATTTLVSPSTVIITKTVHQAPPSSTGPPPSPTPSGSASEHSTSSQVATTTTHVTSTIQVTKTITRELSDFPTLSLTAPVNGTTSGVFYTPPTWHNSSYAATGVPTDDPTGAYHVPARVRAEKGDEVVKVYSTVYTELDKKEEATGKGGAGRVEMSLMALVLSFMVAAWFL